MLNNPFICLEKENQNGSLFRKYSDVILDKTNVILEVVKAAENGEGTILRLYEAFNRREEVSIKFGYPVKQVYECNMLEEKQESLAIQDNQITFTIKPYEIKTLLVIS